MALKIHAAAYLGTHRNANTSIESHVLQTLSPSMVNTIYIYGKYYV